MVKQNIEGAVVTITGNNQTYTGVTNSAGVIEFEGIDEDDYTLTVTCEGYDDYVQENPVSWTGDSQSITVSLNKIEEETEEEETEEEETEEETVTETIDIEVTVDPIVEGATISIADNNSDYLESGVTESTGVVGFSNVPYGSYTLTVTCDGYEEVVQTITVNSTNNNPRSITISLTEKQ